MRQPRCKRWVLHTRKRTTFSHTLYANTKIDIFGSSTKCIKGFFFYVFLCFRCAVEHREHLWTCVLCWIASRSGCECVGHLMEFPFSDIKRAHWFIAGDCLFVYALRSLVWMWASASYWLEYVCVCVWKFMTRLQPQGMADSAKPKSHMRYKNENLTHILYIHYRLHIQKRVNAIFRNIL